MQIIFAESEYDVLADFRKRYEALARQAYADASKLLPFGSSHLNFYIEPRTAVIIAETHDAGHTHSSEFIQLGFDPTQGDTVNKAILEHVRPTVFHEMNHAARYKLKPSWAKTLLESCVTEGLATAFTRDYAKFKDFWADYPLNVADWLQEIIDLGASINWDGYMFRHPDGRKWIGYKVGTYIVDQAAQKSGKSIIELTMLTHAEILQLAGIDTGTPNHT